ncbi:MAG: rubredoxin [Chitinophagaceae bacterium]|nr:rubredoxin [Chitinophagaceae bacterium]
MAPFYSCFSAEPCRQNESCSKSYSGKKETEKNAVAVYVHQCRHCLTVYDETIGEPENNIPAGVNFELLPDDYSCSLCEAEKEAFVKIEKSTLGLQPV